MYFFLVNLSLYLLGMFFSSANWTSSWNKGTQQTQRIYDVKIIIREIFKEDEARICSLTYFRYLITWKMELPKVVEREKRKCEDLQKKLFLRTRIKSCGETRRCDEKKKRKR